MANERRIRQVFMHIVGEANQWDQDYWAVVKPEDISPELPTFTAQGDFGTQEMLPVDACKTSGCYAGWTLLLHGGYTFGVGKNSRNYAKEQGLANIDVKPINKDGVIVNWATEAAKILELTTGEANAMFGSGYKGRSGLPAMADRIQTLTGIDVHDLLPDDLRLPF